MSDDDERQPRSTVDSKQTAAISRRLLTIKLSIQELSREKTKYNVEKLTHDGEFLKGEIDQLRQTIRSLNTDINTQILTKRTLNAEMTNYQSHAGLSYTSMEIALRDQERYQKELSKTNKAEEYRNLAQQRIDSIADALPKLRKLDEYKEKLKAAEVAQETARRRRESLEESLNSKLRKQAEINQLISDSEVRLPEIDEGLEKLRSERKEILKTSERKKPARQRRRRHLLELAQLDSPDQSFHASPSSLPRSLTDEDEMLNNIRLLLTYLREKMVEHHLVFDDLTSPLFHPNLNECQSAPVPIAMRLPRNFAPLTFQSNTTNEILRSPHYPDVSIEYKKELPTDILDKYAGSSNKNEKQTSLQLNFGKKNRKNKKIFGIKHSPQMISLYTDVRLSSGSSDALPSMPMFEYELLPSIQALEVIEQSFKSYLVNVATNAADRDSAVDTYSETSSSIEPIVSSTDALSLRPEQRSSSSSSEKKTIVSSSSSSATAALPQNEEVSALTFQIERQVSDEGYRSVRNGQQQSHETTTTTTSLLKSYALTEKIDQWLSNTNDYAQSNHPTEDFRATDTSVNEHGDDILRARQ